MIDANWQTVVANRISAAKNKAIEIESRLPVSGGCIHSAYQLKCSNGLRYFLKINELNAASNFHAEAIGLNAIAESKTIRVPKVIVQGEDKNFSFLVLEWLEMEGNGNSSERLGRDLANMHRTMGEAFGWSSDNFIGSSPQINSFKNDWITFWIEHRLGPQYKWARTNGWRCGDWDKMIDSIPNLFHHYNPQPSLLHGDLWRGNVGCLTDGTPIVFDPAAYYGDRETDIAFTHFFGGFGNRFYEAYEEAWPLAGGHEKRRSLYNLYHALNHFNLFGGSYGQSALSLVKQILRDFI